MPISRPRASEHQTTTPYWSAPGATLYLGNVRERLRDLPARSIHCVITSPPYWGLRSYLEKDHPDKQYEIGAEPSPDCGTHGQAQCGACFVCSMVSVFREVHRVLRDDGTLWLNLGDTYGGGPPGGNGKQYSNKGSLGYTRGNGGLPDGNLVGVPWRVALALQADGWILRQDIIWYSPNKMPESVQNRCTKSHEHIFLLTKGPDYYFDSVAIEEEASDPKRPAQGNYNRSRPSDPYKQQQGKPGRTWGESGTTNKRDVWIVPTRGYQGAHFATFSPQLITPCILAGTSEHGTCAACRRPWERVVVRAGGVSADTNNDSRDRSFDWSRNGKSGSGSTLDGTVARRETVGWQKICGCRTDEVVPAVVLDPFVGSGTTVATALELGRHGVGIDLSEDYLRDHTVPRIVAAMGTTRRGITIVMPTVTPPTPRRLRG